MSKEKSANDIALKLRTLYKGTLYIGIGGLYILLLGMMLVYVGFLGALLTCFLICLVQLFRYIAGDVDRLGWVMSNKNISSDSFSGAGDATQTYQSRMLMLLVGLIQIANLAIVYQCYVNSTAKWAGLALVAIVSVELMFKQIRKTNREIDYELASYGLKDRSPVHGAVISNARQPAKVVDKTKANDKIDSKLATLQALVDSGDVTESAFQEVKDRLLIERVMS
ncbi:MAG: hypothetical protein HRT35_11765 [Algicola sp.]|nr:hypothetical protein [Algicola sp.]